MPIHLSQQPLLWKVSVTFLKKTLKSSSLQNSPDQCKKFKISGDTPKRIYSMLNLFKESKISERIKLKLFHKKISSN